MLHGKTGPIASLRGPRRSWQFGAAALAATMLTPLVHGQADPPGCSRNSLGISIGFNNEQPTVVGATVYNFVVVQVPDNGVACTVDLDRVTFFRPDNPPDDPQDTCGSPGGLDLPGGDVTLEPGDFVAFTGQNPPPPGFIFNENLIYTVQEEDITMSPEGFRVITSFACTEGITFTGDPPSDALDFRSISKPVVTPAIDVQKSASPEAICPGDGLGDDITFTYRVSIPTDAGEVPPDGDVDLIDITIDSDQCDNIQRLADDPGNNNDVLELGEVWVYECVREDVDKLLECTVTVSGTEDETARGLTVTDTASASLSALDCIGACCLPSGDCLDGVFATSCMRRGGEYQGDGSSCEDPEVMCEQPPGACCLADGTCVEVVEEACDGDYRGDLSLCEDQDCPQPPGACCLADGTCIEVVEEACDGDYRGDFSLCEDQDCPQPPGACCLADGTCIEVVEEACDGDYRGDFSLCEDQDCPQPPGACCLADGTCVEVVEEACDGDYRGDFSLCEDQDCPQPPGACCLADGTCVEVVEEACDGDYRGDFSLCEDQDCPQPPGACCLADGTCIEVVEEACDGDYRGDFSLCEDQDCPQPPGACCLADGTCVEVVEEACDGDYRGDFSLCEDQDCPQPPGACCLADGTCVEVVEEACDGEFQGDMTSCDEVVCEEPPGACCLPNGDCFEGSQSECHDAEGMYQGDGTSCDTAYCPQPKGACCLPNGGCVVVMEDICAPLGEYQGDFTVCPQVECPQPGGACCFEDGSCSEGSQALCEALGGEYQGEGTSCDDVVCVEPEGACCLDDGSCIVSTQADCASLGGLYQGDGITCDSAKCPQPPGACCVGSLCLQLTEEECALNDGDYQGDMVPCEPDTCDEPGACCFEDGSCLEAFQDDCNDAGGLYQGDGTTCVPELCPQPKGACCLDDGLCLVVTEADCDGLGEYQGDFTICSDVDCGPECVDELTVKWNLDLCWSVSGDDSAWDYHEFGPTFNGNCADVDASIVYRDQGKHSCTDDRNGNPGRAMCVGTSFNNDQFIPDADQAVRFEVEVEGPAFVTDLRFWQAAPDNFAWTSWDPDPNPQFGPNNPPQQFGVRVLRDGNEIFRMEDVSTTEHWSQITFAFEGPDFIVAAGDSAAFHFELFSYDHEGYDHYDGMLVTAWDLDDIKVNICCPVPGDPVGACCLDYGDCVITDEWNCVDHLYGDYQGDHTDCSECDSVCPGEGSCFYPNGTPGCHDAYCCEAVCEVDPYCCDVEWDWKCANQAGYYCNTGDDDDDDGGSGGDDDDDDDDGGYGGDDD